MLELPLQVLPDLSSIFVHVVLRATAEMTLFLNVRSQLDSFPASHNSNSTASEQGSLGKAGCPFQAELSGALSPEHVQRTAF